ncbi:FAD-dependent oxidoreductase [Cytobacillus spongiae]|uniref:FAD-dependent oxidoreductase n=1 Tax=Cytobacillus spongiae TaxID=2901381 RepID=UPI001F28BB35|nr:FAD-dependent oxidoreductase [Cytobacillus spongiae]UII56473.1 FAD-dependent oxidoreductase [Cytobacillus spongiae]
MTIANRMPQFPEPYWRDISLPIYRKLIEDQTVDVTIVGGGITGITSAYLLAKEGLKVAIIEAGRILNGTTGHTTAKITAQHGLIYDELLQHFGKEKAKHYYQANSEALQFIRKTIEDSGIACDFSTEDAFLYSTSDENAKKIEKEYEAYQKLGIPGDLHKIIPISIEIKNALSMKEQAQFHPLKYLAHLVKCFTDMGGLIYEDTTAVDIEEGKYPTVVMRNGKKVHSKQVIIASHFPFYDGMGLYYTRMHAERSYVVAVKTKTEYPGGMYVSVDQPTRSLRYTPYNGEKLILISGDGHKTGQGVDTIKHYEALEAFGEEVFGIQEYPYRWSAQDLFTLDKIPYIGPIKKDKENILIATGYHKWGMTNGTAASLLMKDYILGKDNPYSSLFSPSREIKADPSVKEFIKQNVDVAGELLKGKFELVPKDPGDLETDEGAAVMINGKRAGAYKDQDNTLHIVDTTCTHLGCEVEWNHGDRTWDCPCHGSRFSYDGKVIEGPATKALNRVLWNEE